MHFLLLAMLCKHFCRLIFNILVLFVCLNSHSSITFKALYLLVHKTYLINISLADWTTKNNLSAPPRNLQSRRAMLVSLLLMCLIPSGTNYSRTRAYGNCYSRKRYRVYRWKSISGTEFLFSIGIICRAQRPVPAPDSPFHRIGCHGDTLFPFPWMGSWNLKVVALGILHHPYAGKTCCQHQPRQYLAQRNVVLLLYGQAAE